MRFGISLLVLSISVFSPLSFPREMCIVIEGESYGAAVWQIPELYGQLNSPQLERVATLDEHKSKAKCILWWPSGKHDKLISMDEQNLYFWSLDSSKKSAQVQSQESYGMLHYLSGGAWDPLDVKTSSIEHGHFRNLDYDSKNKYMLVTAEGESGIHIWVLRKPKVPVLELPGHAHWTWDVRCNPEFEGLIVQSHIADTTSFAEFWNRLLSILWFASPSGENISESLAESPTRPIDPLLNSYSDYEESVYGLAWSSREPWIFASLPYDGRVVVESVKPHLNRK